MIKVLIIEDEQLAADKLVRQLKKIAPDIHILAKIATVKESVQWLKESAADLIFLDIHLSDGVSFEIFKQVEVKTPIIFTTAYDQYAIRAFKVNSLDYLLKPVSMEELGQALEKYKEYSGQKESNQNIDFSALFEAVKGQQAEYKERFVIQAGVEKMKTIKVEDIAYFFADGKYTFLVENKSKQHLVDFTLEKLTNILNPKMFFRINRKFIIGIHAIDYMFAVSKSRLKVVLDPPCKMDTIVSVERSPEFKKWVNK